MTYILIGYTENTSFVDRCGDYISEPGKFETLFFREDGRADFIKAWAHAQFHGTYEDLQIIINGIPRDNMSNEEYQEFEFGIEKEMLAQQEIVKAEHEVAVKLQKEAAALAAQTKARQLAHMERQRDLQQLEALQRKLNIR